MTNYIFKGKLQAYICKDCQDILANVQVRLYQPRGDQDVTSPGSGSTKTYLCSTF